MDTERPSFAERRHPSRPLRLLVVAPSWVGDAVMATPTFRVLRELIPAAFIGALVRPGIDQLLAGLNTFDETHVAHAKGIMGPKKVAQMVRPRAYDTALLLTGSFSTALIARMAGIPRRIGYERDGRSFMLTESLTPPKRRDVEPFKRSNTDPGAWAPIPATEYYFELAKHFLGTFNVEAGEMGPLDLIATREEELAAADLLERAGLPVETQRSQLLVLLNPGANNPQKRWPPDRFAALADYLAKHHGARVLINGSPAEEELVSEIARACSPGAHTNGPPIELNRFGITLGRLKGVLKRCRLVVTNDTGPRHIAAAFGVPVISLFGPTDHRWTTIPFEDEVILRADPDLPEEEVANDHPERCRIENIGLGDVVAAANTLLGGAIARR